MRKPGAAEWLITFGGMVALTFHGLSETFAFKTPEQNRVLFWFPAALLVKHLTGSEIAMTAMACLQFLAFGALYMGFRYRLGKTRAALFSGSVYCIMLLGGRTLIR